jgi:hypothetical protein
VIGGVNLGNSILVFNDLTVSGADQSDITENQQKESKDKTERASEAEEKHRSYPAGGREEVKELKMWKPDREKLKSLRKEGFVGPMFNNQRELTDEVERLLTNDSLVWDRISIKYDSKRMSKLTSSRGASTQQRR